MEKNVICADIHSHIIFGIDDGAEDFETSAAMLEKEYSSGVRLLCLTPHYNPELFGEYDMRVAQERFEMIREYAKKHFPDMDIRMGNEVCWHTDCIDALCKGKCKTLSGSRYVLVDFHGKEDAFEIIRALNTLISAGFFPVVAHVERYDGLFSSKNDLAELSENGAVFQTNASSVLSERKRLIKPVKKLIKEGIISIVSSDAHNMTDRPVLMKECGEYLASAIGEELTKAVMFDNAEAVLDGR